MEAPTIERPIPQAFRDVVYDRPLNADDLRSFPDDRNRYEIIGGELFVSTSPSTRHQVIVMKIATVLHSFLTDKRMGIALCAPLDVYLSFNDVVQPDLLVVLAGRKDILFEHGIVGAPNLIIEVLSPATSVVDKVKKTALYARNRVEEYWIVDPLAETVRVHCLYAGRYTSSAELSRADRLYSPAMHGLVLDLAAIFPDDIGSSHELARQEEPQSANDE